ncbi:hypothetical protein GE061_006758, partial [Apolygus lucorum]
GETQISRALRSSITSDALRSYPFSRVVIKHDLSTLPWLFHWIPIAKKEAFNTGTRGDPKTQIS